MRKVLVFGAAILAAGCGTSTRVYLNRDVQTVLVLPPFNDSTGANEVPWKLWPYMERQVAAHGYRVVPRGTVEAFYQSKKYIEPEQIAEWTHADLCKEFKVDAIVISRIVEWGATTLGISNSVNVKLTAELREGDGSKEGALVWNDEGSDGYSSSATTTKGILSGVFGSVSTDPGKYAPGAAEHCFRSLPYAGWDPEMKKTQNK